MASNLNKAFMRAYAKDRTASAEEATAASTPVAVPAPVAMPAASTVGLPAASAKPVAHPASVPAPAAATTTSPVANAATIPSSSRIQPVVQPAWSLRCCRPLRPTRRFRSPAQNRRQSNQQTCRAVTQCGTRAHIA